MIKTLLTAGIVLVAACPGDRAALGAPDPDRDEARRHRAHAESSEPVAQDLPGLSIYQLDSHWRDPGNRDMSLTSLRGHPAVAAMIYTKCDYVCPLIVDEMKKIERKLSRAERKQVRFVLISFDPARDTPAALEDFRRRHELDAARWLLLTGALPEVQELAAAIGVRFRAEANGEYTHSTIIHVLDRDGVVRHQLVGLHHSLDRTLAVLHDLVNENVGR